MLLQADGIGIQELVVFAATWGEDRDDVRDPGVAYLAARGASAPLTDCGVTSSIASITVTLVVARNTRRRRVVN
jgi:hypothetical protein